MSYYDNWGYYRKKKSNKRAGQPDQRVRYGQTWWGEQWLNALAKIDYDNRIPRGRAYAGNGSVLETRIDANKIRSKVQGSRPSPYQISIDIPLFNQNQKGKLLEVIRQDPFILSKLLNRELPKELDRMASDHGIRLFPSSWKDFAMHCSCPDWAVPCKHLAAVIYVISREIDSNPFLVLKLHGLDLLEELKETDAGILDHEAEAIPSTETMMVDDVPALAQEPDFTLNALPDFSGIASDSKAILSLLPASPLFYPKDFRALMQSACKSLESGMRKHTPGALPENLADLASRISLFDDTMLLLNEDLTLESVLFSVEEDENKDVRIELGKLVTLLENLDSADLSNANRSLRGIEIHRQFASAIALTGSIIPQLITDMHGEMMIRWIPAVNDPSLRTLTNQVQAYANPGTVWIWSKREKKNAKYFPLEPEENSLQIISLFLGYYMKLFRKSTGVNETKQDKITDMFFEGKPVIFSEPDEKHTANSIQLWLKRLHIGNKKWTPLLHIDEQNSWFLIHFPVINRDEPLQPPVPLQDFLSKKIYETVRFDVLKDLTNLSDLFPDIAFYLQSRGKNPVRFSSVQFTDVFTRIIPMLRMLGMETMMPKALAKVLIPSLSLKLSAPAAGKNPSFINLDELLGFEYQVALGDLMLSPAEFSKLVGKLRGIVKIRDQYVLISNDSLTKLFEQLDHPARLNPHDLLKAALAEEYQGAKVELTPQVKKLIARMTSDDPVSLPRNLTATLRPYQLTGYRWMVRNSKIGFGSLIADDMGLGKTVQVIAALLKFKQEGLLSQHKALVIVPTTLLTNWEKEIEKFAPTLKPRVYHGTSRELDLRDCDLLLTTYGTVRSDLKKLKSLKWTAVVADEAQNIKNSRTDQTKAVKSLMAGFRIAMSGTPVENRLSEYRSIMDFLNPGYLGSEKKFDEEFAKPIQLNHDQKKVALFRKITAPFILRRMKTDKSIISDLPDKIENNHYCTLTGEQAAVYQNIVDNVLKEISGMEGVRRRGTVLKMITALKQICNHPDNFLKKGNALPDKSGKSMMLMDILSQIRDAGEKTLIFTQYREMGDILTEMVRNTFGMEPLFLHGGSSRSQRDLMVEDFQTKRNKGIFILSLKAGGTGLNLTGASHVVHYDLWWNPAVEAQATDRAYRIGQSRNVMVNRLITRGTFEERIDEMLKSKKTLANLTVETGEKWIGELSDQELKEIFMLTF